MSAQQQTIGNEQSQGQVENSQGEELEVEYPIHLKCVDEDMQTILAFMCVGSAGTLGIGILTGLALLTFIGAVGSFIAACTIYYSAEHFFEEMEITPDQVIVRDGIIFKEEEQIFMDRIKGISINEDLEVFDEVEIHGMSAEVLTFHSPAPREVRTLIQHHIQ